MKISTIDELDALPIGSVILDQFVVVSERGWTGWFTTGVEAPDPPHLPATVLFVPGRDLVQEARGEAFEDRLAEIRSIDATVNRAIHKAKEEAYDEGYAAGFHDIDWAHAPNPYRNAAP